MLLLNGVFCWFKKLSEFKQMVLVASGLFLAGVSFGLTFHNFWGVPAELEKTVSRVTDLEENQGVVLETIQEQKEVNEDIRNILANMSVKFDFLATQTSDMHRRVSILACYQEAEGGPVERACIERSLTVIPDGSDGD